MKLYFYLSGLLLCMVLNATSLKAQDASDDDSTGLPGDNFSLPGALELFKKAGSPEDFEKSLNSEDSKVNNLDLNNDGNTDYIRVIDKKENNVHVFILQALVAENESQDIAVIELEKTGTSSAVVQITGDEDIYGEEKIVEPGSAGDNAYHMATGSTVAHGPNADVDTEIFDSGAGIVVNVWAWPCVRFVYAPAYVVWVSPWGWARRPMWWRPWRPLYWAAYRPIRYNYHRHYTVVHTHRIVHARTIYRPARVTSVTVRTRNQVAVNNYRVNRTVQRKTVTGARGNQYQVTKRTTTVNGRHGKASHSHTTVRKKRR
jgi:hypothetical protein